MDERSGQPERLIRLTKPAVLDLEGIDHATGAIWGPAQAERYLANIVDAFDMLAQYPGLGIVVDKHREYRAYVTKFRMRRAAHGHRIIYEKIDGGIRIIRVLHTAMNWQDHI